ncbi:hypothetical protein [Azospirillum sp. TSO5]|uniref:hypothetical protein n=1 Tax=Azospirillum sp. TSO5 TaxID=716760 RepID=UPI000D605C59|nr:hypothetical protein [Azospirillum sp. TSO5]PWC92951.1 hypothetical protein TSO5_16110 [Azospirillum sp. TSO5]
MAKFLTEYDEVVVIDPETVARAIELCEEDGDEEGGFLVYENGRIVHAESHERFHGLGYVTVDASGVTDAREIDEAELITLSHGWVGDLDYLTGAEQGVTTADGFMRAIAKQVSQDSAPEDVSEMTISILAPGRRVVVAEGRVGAYL